MYMGIDVSKETLDVYTSFDNKNRVYKNTNDGFKKIQKLFDSFDVVNCVLEPSGGYESLLFKSLLKSDKPVLRCNPVRAYRFKQALGYSAKTDKIDSFCLCQYAKVLKPVRNYVPTDIEYLLSEYCRRLRQMAENKSREKTPLEKLLII